MRKLIFFFIVFFGVIHITLSQPLIINNQAAYIPPQCYVKTQSEGKIHNPCFACHTDSVAPNFMNDGDTQLEYSFQDYARRNRWSNLFQDRTHAMSKIKDDDILEYVNRSNYLSESGHILVTQSYLESKKEWDANGDGKWSGYIPDSYFNFDQEGFDRDLNNNYTGWRSYLYFPFPGLFVPSAGSFGDVLIRLPEMFRKNKSGEFSIEIYKINLAIVESLIKQKDITIPPVNEGVLGVDLNRNGQLDTASKIVFYQNAVDGSGMHYVGLAGDLQNKNKIKLAAGFFPLNTEFLHSVRYLAVNDASVSMAKRLKELRYAKKVGWTDRVFHEQFAVAEAQERALFPQQLLTVAGNQETGVFNGLGWKYQGFIESKSGELRPQNYEEHVFCVGCHSALGALSDSSFSFHRKVTFQLGKKDWGHWSQFTLDYIASEMSNQYAEYIKENDGLTDYRVKKYAANASVMDMLMPNSDEAIQMNKSYKVIVNEQSFIYGRDANTKPLESVYRVIKPGQKTGISNTKVGFIHD